ncbi:MAG: hypothetical protein A3F10_01865 [Coxiella sp. RIFCSPHIGHO2_12_FULL_42_15]|nr:MAG: hypothetical protein A3F10_01865 [Coxiella sp. RIFCSPHIGHO2_12_FULL_42_15]
MQKIGQYLLANNLRASLITLACMLLPWPLDASAVIILILVTLHHGALKGLGVLAWAILPAAAATWKSPAMAIPYDVAFITGVFGWGFSSLLRLTRSWSRILELAAAMGVIVVLAIHLLPSPLLAVIADGLQRIILENLQHAVQSDLAPVKEALGKIAAYLLGSLYTVFALFSIICVMLARLWQLKLIAAAGEKRIEFYSIRVSRILAVFSALVVIAMFTWKINWLVSLSQVAILPFVFAGFSMLIYLNMINQSHKYWRFVLLLTAVMILLFLPRYLLISLALVGFVDSWINFRKWHFLRIKRVNS